MKSPPRQARKRTRGRNITACLDCQRRKKKCDGQWPCNHCRTRRIAHLCNFGGTVKQAEESRQQTSQTESSTGSRTIDGSQKATNPDVVSAVQILGYLEGGIFEHILPSAASQPVASTMASELPAQMLQAARAVSPRPYTDTLVQNFFDHVNYHYGILHQPSFMVHYVDWWHRRRSPNYLQKISAIALTCLVLRICANSAQFLDPGKAANLESELGVSIEVLGSGYQAAAQILSDFIPPGAGGLMNAQQLFLGATWLKGDAEFVKSWHALATAVRQAQEVGLHADTYSDDASEFDKELGHRLWCSLYTWDRFMMACFNRPPIIPGGTTVPMPNPNVDQPMSSPEVPALNVAKIMENQLARQFAETGVEKNITLADALSYVDNWMESMPAVFSINDTNRKWDAQYPRLVFQRLQLHCVGYMTKAVLLRRHLLSSWKGGEQESIDNSTQTDRSMLLSQVIDISLKTMAVCKELYDACCPRQAKYFMIAFCPFDNASFLCSILLHEKNQIAVPRRMEVITAVGQALYIASCLRGYTKMGDATGTILAALVSQLELPTTEKNVLDYAARSGLSFDEVQNMTTDSTLGVPFDFTLRADPHMETFATSDWHLFSASFGSSDELQNIDLGPLDGVWDWEGLQLGSFESTTS